MPGSRPPPPVFVGGETGNAARYLFASPALIGITQHSLQDPVGTGFKLVPSHPFFFPCHLVLTGLDRLKQVGVRVVCTASLGLFLDLLGTGIMVCGGAGRLV
ncbi:hypothetical protein LY76DRAFT_231056 [Colletotrichum caudatum]|nr:hypothetical protein LY76DRAFT_231056 [Colletotrichum caudatum]